jgi:hypothetical protein
MAINEAVNIDIDVNGVNTVKQAADAYEDLGDAVSQTQLEAEKLAQQFGINDKRTQEAIKVAGRYKQEMEQLDFAIDAARGGSDQLFRAAQGVTAGFEVAAGAVALFGGESEELEKVMLKVQGAMVFSQGLKDLQEFGPALVNLAATVRSKVVTAFTTLRGALIATGIGAAAVAVGALLANWDKFTSYLTKTFPILEKLGSLIGSVFQQMTDAAGITSEAARQQERFNEAIQDNIDETERQIKIAQARGDQAKVLALQESKLLDELTLAQQAYTEDESAENEKRLKDIELNLELTRIAQENHQRKLKEIRDKARAEEAKERAEREAERQKEIRLENERQNETQGAVLKTTETKLESDKIVFDSESFLNKAEDKYTKDKIARLEAEAMAQEELYYLSQDLGNAVVSLLGEQTAAGKAVALAQIAADTARALSGALANSNSPTPENVATGGLAGIAKYIALATTIVTNAKRAIDIVKSENVTGAASGSASLPSQAGATGFQAPSVRLPRTEQFTGQQRIYVTEYDISNTQEKVRVTEDVSIVK